MYSIIITPVTIHNPKLLTPTLVVTPHPWTINGEQIVSVEDRSVIVGSPAFSIRMADGYQFDVTVDPFA